MNCSEKGKRRKVKISFNKSIFLLKDPQIRTIFQNWEEFSLKISSNGTILIKFTHGLAATAKWLLHVTDKAATAKKLTATVAGRYSDSSFISSCRRRSLPSSDLKLAISINSTVSGLPLYWNS